MRLAMFGGALACCVLAAVLLGCSQFPAVTIGNSGPHAVHHGEGHGPPPHAPAHGHRRKHHASDGGAELVFDSGLGVYVAVDIPNHYYWDGIYLRFEDGGWYASTKLKGGDWNPHSSESVPPGLRKQKTKHGKSEKHPGRGRGPAKGRW